MTHGLSVHRRLIVTDPHSNFPFTETFYAQQTNEEKQNAIEILKVCRLRFADHAKSTKLLWWITN